ncbi:hypothetical protein V500_00612 [Pseudogymnoascus sp. VKM F-4518 (FW-2643)]|nr:hypothetical protein V500_00612 [Pseudogymnoascus sp. VKM F-4518 (FW-2643)]
MHIQNIIIQAVLASSAVAVQPQKNRITDRDWMTYNNIDSQATSGAKSLLKFLQGQFGWHYLSGQQSTPDLKWVQQYIGKTPAILGSDFIDYSPSRVAYGSSSTEVENAMSFNSAGGINAFVWHWNAPNCLYNSASEPWYSGFYTAATCFNIQTALAEGSNGADYKLIIRDIDAIAVQIKRLSDAGIPILFRPLHEPDGGWFWWGAHGSAPFKQLWGILYDRLTNYHGLHNMVWVCNTMKSDWYPGNDKCDIVTTDIYASAGDHSVQASSWETLYGLSNGQRIIALAEVGVIPDPEQQVSQNIPWAYWVTWAGQFIEDGNYNSRQFLYDVYSDSHVATVDGVTKIGNWKST